MIFWICLGLLIAFGVGVVWFFDPILAKRSAKEHAPKIYIDSLVHVKGETFDIWWIAVMANSYPGDAFISLEGNELYIRIYSKFPEVMALRRQIEEQIALWVKDQKGNSLPRMEGK